MSVSAPFDSAESKLLRQGDQMKFEVTRHKNGYLIKAEDEEEGIVYEEIEDDEVKGWVHFLRVLTDEYGPDENRSRYSPNRIYIEIRPGDKWEPPEGSKNSDYWCEKCDHWIKKND